MMRNKAWIGFVSRRWFAARKASGGAASSVLASAGLAVGVAALIVVLGVMNGFQMGYIESILEVSSFHVRVTKEGTGGPDWSLVEKLSSLRGVRSVLPFVETVVLASGADGGSLPLKLEAVPPDAGARDPGFISALGLAKPGAGGASSKTPLFSGSEGIALGSELSRSLNAASGSSLSLTAIVADPEEGIGTRELSYPVTSVFHSGYYEFDSNLGLISLEEARDLFPKGAGISYVYGVKLKDRYADRTFLAEFKKLGLEGASAESWRDYNRSFFGALRTEKTVMMLLVGLIFLVVGVNIYHSMRRNVAERMEDIAVLKALGGSAEELTRSFMLDGLAVGLAGALSGAILGLLIAVNINGVFHLVEVAVNGALGLAARLFGGGEAAFSIFSPQYFYLMEVPVRVLFPETCFVVAAAIGSSVAAAWSAASRVASYDPAEVLRYE
jgi:lipoprotein-releasing system permease protein